MHVSCPTGAGCCPALYIDMNPYIRISLFALTVLAVSFATFAFASSRTGQPVGGEGANLVSGYDVSGVHYLLAQDPSLLAAVEFDLNASAHVVKVSANSSNARLVDCRNTGGYHWVCDFNSSVHISDVNELRVFATGG